MNAKSILSIVGFAVVSIGAGVASAQILEVNVTDSPDFLDGQTAVNVNPTNPNNLVFTATHHSGCIPADPSNVGSAGSLCQEWSCFIGYSTDRGQTWSSVLWPGDPACGEPSSFVDSAGTFYVAYNDLSGDMNPLTNHVLVASSTDGGATWSDPVPTSVTLGKNPKSRVDATTRKLYVVGGIAFAPNGLAVSADRGQTWSSAVPFPGDHIAVHDGILATGSMLPVLTLHVSRDDGQTYTPRTVTNTLGVPVTGGNDPYLIYAPPTRGLTPQPPWISADPTRTGRFAVMQPRGDTFEVYVTQNAGLTWTGPAVIPAPLWAFPWMDFGPTGLLGVMWRTGAPTTSVYLEQPADPVDVYSVVSFDHGRSFSSPVQVNSVTALSTLSGPPGDDWSWITVDDDHAFVGWADARNGNLEGFVSRVPLSLYGP